jgi:hypothetical protein
VLYWFWNPPHERRRRHQAGVRLGVDRGRHHPEQASQVDDVVRLPGALQLIDQGQVIDGLVPLVQVEHRLVDGAVLLTVEVAGRE